jgi:hypothetical protein
MRPSFRIMPLVLVFTCGFVLPLALRAQDSKTEGKSGSGRWPEHSDELVERLKKGRDKLTEAQVSAMLGHPDSVEFNTNPSVVANIRRPWEDHAAITIDFKDEMKAVRIVGRFSENLKLQDVNMENFRKLKPAMSHPEVEKLLGSAGKRVLPDPGEGILRWEWQRFRRVNVTFSEGKVSGVAWNLSR